MNLIKHFHSLPAFYLLVLFGSGITISSFAGGDIDILYIVILFTINTITLFCQSKNQKPFFYLSALNFLLAGFLYGWFSLFPLNSAEFALFDKNITAIQGTIVQVNQREDKKNIYVLSCEKSITKNGTIKTEGRVVINHGKYLGKIDYGDLLRIYSKPQLPPLPANPGEFNYRKYLQLNKQFFYLQLQEDTKVTKILSDRGNWAQSNFFNPLRNTIRSIINNYLSQQSASIVKALILGDKGSLDSEVLTDFQKTGVIHVLAISGLHVGFIALLLQFILTLLRVPKKLAMAIVVFFLVLFLVLVDFKAPVVRASLMLAFYYLSKFIMRPQDPINVVSLAGILILLVSPEELFLPGFQYSFLAVFGLIYGNKKLAGIIPVLNENRKWKKTINAYILKPFISSLSAILATVPLTWYYFGSFQIGALIANIFVIPLIGIVVFLSITFLFFSPFNFLPLDGIATIIDLIIEGMVVTISSFADVPFVQILTGHPPLMYLIFISVAIYLLFNISNKKNRIAFLYISSAFIFIVFSNYFRLNTLRITFIDVGQGDAALVQFPNGKTALIDAGYKGFGFDAGMRYVDPVLKYYGINTINYLIGSHPHSDHIGGFGFILDNYPVDSLIFNEVEMTSNLYKDLISKANHKKIPVIGLGSGDILNIDQRVRIYVLHPSDYFENVNTHVGASINNSSLVLKLQHGKNSILFCGDAETESEQELLKYNNFLDCDLIKVGHHGSKTSSIPEFINKISPEYAVISVGKNNKFKHPNESTLLRFAQLRIPALRTDISGAVIFESNGKKLNRIIWR